MLHQSGRKPTSKPLTGPPPLEESSLPCKPTLIFGLSPFISEELRDVLQSDLVYSGSSRFPKLFSPVTLNDSVMLRILQLLDGKSLSNFCRAVGGSVIVDMEDIYDDEGDVREGATEPYKNHDYQAIILADYSLSEEGPVRDFVREKYLSGTTVVVMAVEGLFNMSYMRVSFGVNWRMTACTKKTIYLTDVGQRIIGSAAFPFENKYVKSHFVVGEGDVLFAEYINAADYEDDSDPVPDPEPGSPVITHISQSEHDNDIVRCVSYFGFVNSLDVSYGAIIHRLCYAAQHQNNNEIGRNDRGRNLASSDEDDSTGTNYEDALENF